MDDRKLINLVSQHPEIYDIYGEGFSNKNLKEQAWNRIAKGMEMTSEWWPLVAYGAFEMFILLCPVTVFASFVN